MAYFFNKLLAKTTHSDFFSFVQYTHGKHRSNAEELIAKVPVVEVDTTVAVCDGGGGTLGHPLEYIQVNTAVPGQVQTCKYCGIRYKMKAHHH